MARVSHIAVHVVAAADAIGLEEARDRGRGCDGLGDRHVLEGIEPKDHPLAPVEMGGRDEERAPTLTKAVGQALGREGLAHEALQRRHGEEAGRHVRSAPRQEVRPLEAEACHRLLADGPDELGEVARGIGEGALVIDGAPLEVQRVVRLLVEEVVEARRPDTVGKKEADTEAEARPNDKTKAVAPKIGGVASAAEAPASYMPPITPPPARTRARLVGGGVRERDSFWRSDLSTCALTT